MAISSNKEQKENDSLIESTSTANQVAQAVCNPDGSNIGGGGGTSDVNIEQLGGVNTATGSGVSNTGTLRVTQGSTSMQSQGVDATGQDAYATVKTPSANATHLKATLGGANAAIISLDGGTTDNFTLLGGESFVADALTITSGVAIQAKNATGGSNYTSLSISIW